jgi:hypothetical protein
MGEPDTTQSTATQLQHVVCAGIAPNDFRKPAYIREQRAVAGPTVWRIPIVVRIGVGDLSAAPCQGNPR